VSTSGSIDDTELRYRHDQLSADLVWTINHNLGTVPSIELFNSGSVEIKGYRVNMTVNQAVVTFNQPQAGFAICQ
jgi:hypothetical protein